MQKTITVATSLKIVMQGSDYVMAMSELKQRILKYELAKAGFPNAEYVAKSIKMKVQADNERMPVIFNEGDMLYGTEYSDLALNKIAPVSRMVNEMLAAWENSRTSPFIELSQYKVLAEYNNIVLAARDDGEYGRGLFFATWEYDKDGAGVHAGYYTEDYADAKESFATRSGMVQKSKIITEETAADIKAAVDFCRLNTSDFDLEKRLQKINATLCHVYPAIIKEKELPSKMRGNKPSLQEKLDTAKKAAQQADSKKVERTTKPKNQGERE